MLSEKNVSFKDPLKSLYGRPNVQAVQSMASAAHQLHHLLAVCPQLWYKTFWILSFSIYNLVLFFFFNR